MSQNTDNQPSSPDEIGSVRGRSDLQPAPLASPDDDADAMAGAIPDAEGDAGTRTSAHFPPDSGLRGSDYFPPASEAGYVVRAGPCGVDDCRFYWRVVSSDGVRLLQCISCGTLYLDG
jgi:hypothetical protein